MLKTLRITSIILVVCGAVLVIMSAVYGVRRDESIERFLEQPGVVEEFKKQKRDKPEPSRQKNSHCSLTRQSQNPRKQIPQRKERPYPESLQPYLQNSSLSEPVCIKPSPSCLWHWLICPARVCSGSDGAQR